MKMRILIAKDGAMQFILPLIAGIFIFLVFLFMIKVASHHVDIIYRDEEEKYKKQRLE